MTTKNVMYDFWRVEVPTTFAAGFEGALQQLSQMNSIASRNQEIDGNVVRWEELDLSNARYLYGDIGKLRMQVLPQKGGINQLSSSLNLSQTEGVDELFAFLYDKNSRILITQYNHYGASLNSFLKYLNSKINFGGPIHFFPVLSRTGASKLATMNDIRKVVYKVARPTTNTLNPLAGSGFDSALEQMDQSGAYTVESTISTDRSRQSLLTSYVRDFFGALSRNQTADVKLEKYVVTGYLNGNKDEFDLVKDRMRHQEQLPIAPDRTVTFQNRKDAALRAFSAKRSELVAQFGACCS